MLKNKSVIFPFAALLLYSVLLAITINNGYFWDNIQQISKEAHWFYLTDFSSVYISPNSPTGIVATGYHPPLMGIMTALLWNAFGYNLWVSHALIFMWALVLCYNLWKLIIHFIPEKWRGWTFLLIMIEPTLLAQYSIASPDFILLTAFIVSLRAILEDKKWLLAVGIFFLCLINMRGVFACVIVFVADIYRQMRKGDISVRSIYRSLLPYLPTFIVLCVYYVGYFIVNGWFFTNSAYSDHYSMPQSLMRILTHLAEFGLRNLENGRFAIWLVALYMLYKTVKTKTRVTEDERVLFLLFFLLIGLYLLFVFITQMPFSARYFMPYFSILTILSVSGLIKYLDIKKLKIMFGLLFFLELTGNFWIYPDKIAKSWDCTLAHLPYYELRQECFDYIDQQKIDYKDVSAGFCFYGDRKFVELKNANKIIGGEPDQKFFIYSNISNVEDSLYSDLKNENHWLPIKEFKKGFVDITIFQRNQK